MAPTATCTCEPCPLFSQKDYGNLELSDSNEMSNLDSDFCNDVDLNKLERLSDIQRFYHGKNVLITGGTGFLGKILVEKLLRSCPGVENLYLLVRQKRGKDIYTRMEEIFDDPIFNRLKEEVPKFRHKVVVVPSDCEAAGLGLTISDRQMLIEKVNIIFHSAATVRFDEHLRAALAINVKAPLQLMDLARDIRDLDVFMHISTAYSNCHLSRIEEKYYPFPCDCHQLYKQIDKLTNADIDVITPQILGPWPNTYTFTKALAEKELKANAGKVPLGIFRPAIVISTVKEPLRCWMDNMYGPTGVAVGGVTGMLRSIQVDGEVTADIVPVDSVVNCLLVAASSVHQDYKNCPPSEPPLYNYVSSVENRLSWGDYMTKNIDRVDNYPLSESVWYVALTLNKYAIMNNIYIFFLHLIPAVLIDGLTICIGRKPKMLKVYKKIHKFSSLVSYFCIKELQFCNKRVRKLWDNTSEMDRKIFPFSMSELDWEEYFDEYILGLRRYLFKESDDTLPRARIKWRRLYYLHQIAKIFFLVLGFYILWSIFNIFW